MTNERILRLIAGFFIILSVLLYHFQNDANAVFASANWLWFTLFVGVNLLQSGFSNWCPMMSILKKVRG